MIINPKQLLFYSNKKRRKKNEKNKYDEFRNKFSFTSCVLNDHAL